MRGSRRKKGWGLRLEAPGGVRPLTGALEAERTVALGLASSGAPVRTQAESLRPNPRRTAVGEDSGALRASDPTPRARQDAPPTLRAWPLPSHPRSLGRSRSSTPLSRRLSVVRR